MTKAIQWITLCLVPTHCTTQGKEVADRLANMCNFNKKTCLLQYYKNKNQGHTLEHNTLKSKRNVRREIHQLRDKYVTILSPEEPFWKQKGSVPLCLGVSDLIYKIQNSRLHRALIRRRNEDNCRAPYAKVHNTVKEEIRKAQRKFKANSNQKNQLHHFMNVQTI